jgi:hypothetical protein
VAGDVEDGAERVVEYCLPALDEGVKEPAPGACIRAVQGLAGGAGAPLEEGRGAIVEGVREGGLGVDPGEAVALEGEGAEEGGGDPEGVDGRAEVVREAGEGERSRAGTAADLVAGLVGGHAAPRAGEGNGGG